MRQNSINTIYIATTYKLENVLEKRALFKLSESTRTAVSVAKDLCFCVSKKIKNKTFRSGSFQYLIRKDLLFAK